MKKRLFFFTTLICLFTFAIATTVWAGDCDDNCDDRNPDGVCYFYNGPGDHGICYGWEGEPPPKQ
jgi:hypothetical protein